MQKSDDVTEIMVAVIDGTVRAKSVFKIEADVLPMLKNRCGEASYELLGHCLGVVDQQIAPGDIHDPDRRLHSADPVHTVGAGVIVQPVSNLSGDLRGVALVSG